MRRLVLSLVVLLVFAGCDDAGNGSSSGKGAVENPATLERCVSGETDRGGGGHAATLDSAPQNFGGIELHTNGDVVGFVEDEQCRVRVGYVETPQDLEELEKGTREYVEPFSVPLGSTIYYYSVDRAGNFDTPRQVVVDERSIGTTTSEPMTRS